MKQLTFLVLAALVLGAGPLFAQPARLAAPAAGDLVPAALIAPGRALDLEVPREPVHFAWPLDPAAPLDATVAPIVTDSRSYALVVDAERLADGVALPLTAPGAVVRLHPLGAAAETVDALAIRPERLVVTIDGRRFADGTAMETLVGAAALETAGVPFAPGTSAFRLRGDQDNGTVTLAAPDLAAPTGTRYQISVFEPASTTVLRLGADRADFHAGDTVRFEASVVDGDRPLRARIEGFVSSPDGRTWPLRFETGGDGVGRASWTAPAVDGRLEGLWQVHTRAHGRAGGGVLRDGRAPFAVALPTARLLGDAEVVRGDGELIARLGVETVAAGRYEARAVLWGTDARGERRPLAAASVAAWIEAGVGEIALRFGPEAIGRSALGAPYELRDLRLVDQGRMGLLQRQALGLIVE